MAIDWDSTAFVSINQWRVCFEWKEESVWNVEIVDYH